MELIYFFMLVLLMFLAIIPAQIAKNKGHSFWGYYIFGLCFFLPALVVALLVADKTEGSKAVEKPVNVKYHVAIQRKDVGNGAWREYWTCPECGHSWYVKGEARRAHCGSEHCGVIVALEKQSGYTHSASNAEKTDVRESRIEEFKFCAKCGAKMKSSRLFCPECGADTDAVKTGL